MHKAGIYNPSDLIQFPWERQAADTHKADENEIMEMQAIMAAENERLAREKKSSEE